MTTTSVPSGPAPFDSGSVDPDHTDIPQRPAPGSAWATSRLVPWALGLVAAVVSGVGSWIPSLWGDEATSVMSATRPLGSLFRMLGYVDAVHGTYYFGLHWWVLVFGASPFSVRVPPAIAVGLTVVAVVLLVRRLGGPRLAVAAAIVCIMLPRVTYMGEETRSYAFSAAALAWTLVVLLDLLSGRRQGRRWWILYAALVAVGIYVFLYTALMVVGHAILLAAVRARRGTWIRFVVAIAAAAVVASPVAVFSVLERSQISFLAGSTTTDFTSLAVGLWFWTWWYAALAWALIVVAVAVWVIGLVRARTAAPAAVDRAAAGSGVPSLTLVGLVWLVVPGGILLATNFLFADFTGRYLSMSAPGAALLMTAGIATIARHRRIVLAGLVVLVTVAAVPSYLSQRTPYAKNSSDWAEISRVVGEHAAAGGAVVFDESTRPSRRPRLALHTYPQGFAKLKDVTLSVPYQKSVTWHDDALTVPEALARGRFDGYTQVWVVEYSTGKTADTYGLKDLEQAGYSVAHTYSTYRSRIVELVK